VGNPRVTAYYNEINPKAAAWLRRLIAQGKIAPGVVDERSIEDVRPSDLTGYTQHHFFAGIGGWSYALRQAGWPDDQPAWTGSCPCQPFSTAGHGAGADDPRHLWPAFAWLIRQQKPDIVLGEQVAKVEGLAWFDGVSADLERDGYTIGAAVTTAASFGAPHVRERLYWLAYPNNIVRKWSSKEAQRSPNGRGHAARLEDDAEWLLCSDGRRRPTESGVEPLAHGFPGRMGLFGGYGNAVCIPQAAAFIEAFMRIEESKRARRLSLRESLTGQKLPKGASRDI
jgi:DNA (cytosine-5)-methyltransferase 1